MNFNARARRPLAGVLFLGVLAAPTLAAAESAPEPPVETMAPDSAAAPDDGSATSVPEPSVVEDQTPPTTSEDVPEEELPAPSEPLPTDADAAESAPPSSDSAPVASPVTSDPVSDSDDSAAAVEAPGVLAAPASASAVVYWQTPTVYGFAAQLGEDDWGSYKTTAVSLSWSGDADAYELEKRPVGSTSWRWVDDVYVESYVETYYSWSQFDTFEYRITPYRWSSNESRYVPGTPATTTVTATPPTYPPSTPTAVSVTASRNSATVAWTAPSTDSWYCTGTYSYCDPATSYLVMWRTGSGEWTTATTSSTSYTMTGLRSGSKHYVVVQAQNAAGASEAATSVEFTPHTVPAAVRGVRASLANRAATVSWTEPSDGGSPIVRYAIQYRRAGASRWTYAHQRISPYTGSYTVRNLTPGVRYSFRVVAVNAAGMGAWSNAPSMVVRAAPGAVPSLRLTSGRNTSRVSLNWGAPNSGGLRVLYYRVEEYLGYWRLIDTTTSRSMSLYNVFGCRTMRVAAVTAAGVGTYSPVHVCGATTPGAVTNLRSTPGFGSVTLYWNAGSSGGDPIRYYRVEVWMGWYWRTIGTTRSTSMYIYNVIGRWDYRVTAVNGAGAGLYNYIYTGSR